MYSIQRYNIYNKYILDTERGNECNNFIMIPMLYFFSEDNF